MKRFSIEENGYKISEVNEFVSEVASVIRSNKALLLEYKDRVSSLEEELSLYKDNSGDELFKYQEMTSSIKSIAKKEASLILDAARLSADRIVNDALDRVSRLESKKELLERDIKLYQSKVRDLLKRQMEIVDDIDIF